MTDQPGSGGRERLPAPRPPSAAAPAERFSAPPRVHAPALTPERAAKIVRQSSNARWVGFLATLVVVLFVVLYYFYELGAPLGLSTPRLTQQADAQQVTSIERGYNLFQANCARCHGPNGKGTNEGFIAPPLNDQAKLFVHLSPQYIKNVLTVGGRYVCGNANSLMPVWADTNGGPLNYEQINDLIAFIRAPDTSTYQVRDPSTNEPTGRTFTGWLDPSFKPAPSSTPVPDCYLGTPGGGGTGGSSSPAPSLPAGATTLEVTAANIAFDVKTLSAPANAPFAIHFTNNDVGVPHDVDIRTSDGTTLVSTAQITGTASTTYVIPALKPGTYTFICSVHPIPAMTGTLTVH